MTADAPQTPAPPPDFTARATAAVTEAARTVHDFGGWLAGVLAAAAGELGSTDALTYNRPGSWEASLVDGLVKGTVGHDDEYLVLPEWRTRAPEFGHEAYGLRVGTIEHQAVAAGHVDLRRFLAAANHFSRAVWAGPLTDELHHHQLRPQHLYAVHLPGSTPQAPKLTAAGITAQTRGAFPVTVMGEAWF